MNNKKTFHEVSEIWCDAKRPIVKHSTLCAYQLTLQTHLLPRFGAAENITEKDVQQFVIDKCTSGLARKTVRDIVAVLKSVIKYGNKHGIFHFEEWEIEYPTQTENKLPPTLSLNHQRILMRHLLEQPTPQNIGVLLALCTGMRIGEVCALKWEDVDFAQKTVIVKHTVGRIYNCELKSTERVHSSRECKIETYRQEGQKISLMKISVLDTPTISTTITEIPTNITQKNIVQNKKLQKIIRVLWCILGFIFLIILLATTT